MKRFWRNCGLAMLLVLSACGASLAQTTWYVATNGADSGRDGQSWPQAFLTISNAVAQASATVTNTILVSNGTYQLTTAISVTKPVTIRGTNAAGTAYTAIIDGMNSVRCFNLAHTNALLADLTITRGSAVSGGGVYITNGILSNCWVMNCAATEGGGVYVRNDGMLVDCVISNNLASVGQGGGVFFYGGSGTNRGVYTTWVVNNIATNSSGGGLYLAGVCMVSNSTVRANMADNGGGIDMYSPSYAQRVANCVIEMNIATNPSTLIDHGIGGGIRIYMAAPNVVIERCDIINNAAYPKNTYHGGGGLYLDAGALILNCSIISNRLGTGGQGGGVFIGRSYQSGLAILKNCLIAYNNSLGDGGGLYHYRNFIELYNCTIVSNTASSAGGAARLGSMSAVNGGVMMMNTIIYQNSATTYSNMYIGTGVAWFTNNCVGTDIDLNAYGSGNRYDNPMFNTGSFRLTPKSPCLNAGLNLSWMEGVIDLDGNSRIDRLCRIVDQGCYEHQPQGTIFSTR